MSPPNQILAPEDATELAQRSLVRPDPSSGHIRVHKRLLNRSSEIEDGEIPLDIPTNSPEEVDAFATIPRFLVSFETIKYLGFSSNKAHEVWQTWTNWPASGPRRETDDDEGGLQVSFLDFILGRIWSGSDTSDDDNEKWMQCFHEHGIDTPLQNAIMDHRFKYLRLSQSCLYWVKDTIRQRYAGLAEIKKESQARGRQLLAALDAVRTNRQGTRSHASSSTATVPVQVSLPNASGSWLSAEALAARNAPGAVVLYKGLDQARVRGLFDEDGNIADISTLWSSPPTDFSPSRAMFYFTPDRKVAEYYAAYAKRRSAREAVIILCFNIPKAAVEMMQAPDIRRIFWPSADWKQLIWTCRTKRRLPEHLRATRDATLIIGNIARKPDSVYQNMRSPDELNESCLLKLRVRPAVQYVFSGEEEGQDFLLNNGIKGAQTFVFTHRDFAHWDAEEFWED